MQLRINNEIFAEFVKCPRAGFLYATKGAVASKDDLNLIRLRKNDIAEHISSQFRKTEERIEILKEITSNDGKLEALLDVIVLDKENKATLFCCYPIERKIGKYEIYQASYSYIVAKNQFQIENIVAVRYKIPSDGTKINQDNLYYQYITEAVKSVKRQQLVQKQIFELNQHIRNNSTPKFSPHYYCIKPYACPLKSYCYSKGLENNGDIFDLRDTRYSILLKNYWNGYRKISEIPEEVILPEQSERQKKAHTLNQELILKEELRRSLQPVSKLSEYLILDVDFLSQLNFKPNKSKSISQIPFAFCLVKYSNTEGAIAYSEIAKSNAEHHIQELNERLISHLEYFDKHKIIVYGKTSLLTKLKETSNKISSMTERFWDLQEVIKNKEYYNPGFKGSNYLKDVSKVCIPQIYNDSDDIKSGIQAQLFFKKYFGDAEVISEAHLNILQDYVKRDGIAIYYLFNFICKKSSTKKAY